MNVPQQTLDGWRAAVERLRNQVFAARRSARAGNGAAAVDTLDRAHDEVITLGVSLDQAGAQRPDTLRRPTPVPLEMLSTPANRRYLDALEEAHRRALAVDAERYGEGEDGPAAGMIELLVSETREEVFGPVGRVRE